MAAVACRVQPARAANARSTRCHGARRSVQPVRAMLDFAAQTAALAAAGPLPLVAGGLAAAGLASLVPPPPAGLREPVSVSLEGGKAPLNTVSEGGGRSAQQTELAPVFGGCSTCMRHAMPCPAMAYPPQTVHPPPHRSTAWGAAASSRPSRAKCWPLSAWAGGTLSVMCRAS